MTIPISDWDKIALTILMIVLETRGLTTHSVPFKLEAVEQLSQLSSKCSLAFYTIYQCLCFDHIFFQHQAKPKSPLFITGSKTGAIVTDIGAMQSSDNVGCPIIDYYIHATIPNRLWIVAGPLPVYKESSMNISSPIVDYPNM